MKTSLAGHNILLVDKSKKSAAELIDGFKTAGANIFFAEDMRKGQDLQDQWDIDIVVAEMSFLLELGDAATKKPGRFSAKSAPLLFGFGKNARLTNILQTRGVLCAFDDKVTTKSMVEQIAKYLFDPKAHILAMTGADQIKQISLVLQNAVGKWDVDVQELTQEGLSGSIAGKTPQGETAVLSILFPDHEQAMRFAVRVETITKGTENILLKVLYKEQERWKDFLRMLEAKQFEIDQFLLMSSGR